MWYLINWISRFNMILLVVHLRSLNAINIKLYLIPLAWYFAIGFNVKLSSSDLYVIIRLHDNNTICVTLGNNIGMLVVIKDWNICINVGHCWLKTNKKANLKYNYFGYFVLVTHKRNNWKVCKLFYSWENVTAKQNVFIKKYFIL